MAKKQQLSKEAADLKALSKLSGYKFDAEKLAEVKQGRETRQRLDGDALLEEDIYIRCKANRDLALLSLQEMDEEGQVWGPIPEVLPKTMIPEVRAKIARLFGKEHQETLKADALKPFQSRFIEKFFRTRGNWGMSFRTGMGKTRAFLEIAKRSLIANPDQIVIISTPVGNLVSQIRNEINNFESLKLLKGLNAKDLNNLEKSDPDQIANDRERLDIASENLETEAYLAELEKFLGTMKDRLIIATPQKIDALLFKRKIDPKDVGLFVVDEGGIGSSAQTGKYSSFLIYDRLKKAGGDFRVICADATPAEFDYFTKKFEITRWDFGEAEEFVNLHVNEKATIKMDEKQKEIAFVFLKILNQAWDNFKARITENVYNWVEELRGENLTFKEGEQPYLSIETYEKLKLAFNKSKRLAEPDFVKLEIGFAYEKLVAFFRTQLFYTMLMNESYETVLLKLEKLMMEFEALGANSQSAFRRDANRSLLQLKHNQKIDKSPIYAFADYLKMKIDDPIVEHPKVVATREILKNLIREKKKVLVLCNHLETANVLNHKATQEWGIKSAVIHGSSGEKKKNSLRQQFVFEKFNMGDYEVIFATSVAERGLDLFEIDYVISYAPSANVISEYQAMGRMRKGGTMITLVTDDEIGKFFKNKRAKEAFLDTRQSYLQADEKVAMTVQTDSEQSSKFHGKRKTSFFVNQIVEKFGKEPSPLVSERFHLQRIWPPKQQILGAKTAHAKLVYSMHLEVSDKTGWLDCYYSFENMAEANLAFNRLRDSKILGVIVNAEVRRSVKGKIYLLATHHSKYFEQGVIPCPDVDVNLDDLRRDGIMATRYTTLPKVNISDYVPRPLPAELPKKGGGWKSKTGKREVAEEQLGLFVKEK